MNYINNGEYYLVACYSNNEKEIIDIDKKWYYGTESEMQTGVDIAAIDIVTTKFNNIDELKQRMFKNGYIKDITADLYIVHKSKYNGKEHLSEYELLFKNERTKLIISASKKRLNNENIEFNDINNFLNKFITKVFYTESFSELITCPWIKIDEGIKDQLLEMNKSKKESLLENPDKVVKPKYNIKYKNRNKFTSYTIFRNIVSAWNIYDELVNKYNKENPNYSESELSKVIINLYIDTLKNSRTEIRPELMKMVDKENVKGQITLEEYVKEKEMNSIQKRNFEEIKQYDQKMDQIYRESSELSKSTFDDAILRTLEEKYGRENVNLHLTEDILRTINDTDRFRLGIIDYIEYKNSMRNNNGKRHR